MFLDMCILAGCDYLPSPKGIGIMTANKLVRKYRDTRRLLRGIRFDGFLQIPQNYDVGFIKARLTFRHHKVWRCYSTKECLEPLNPVANMSVLATLPENDREMHFAGPPLDHDIARQIAEGSLNPLTKQPFITKWIDTHKGTDVMPKKSKLLPYSTEPTRKCSKENDSSRLVSKYFALDETPRDTPEKVKFTSYNDIRMTQLKTRETLSINRNATLFSFAAKKPIVNMVINNENDDQQEPKVGHQILDLTVNDSHTHSSDGREKTEQKQLSFPLLAKKSIDSSVSNRSAMRSKEISAGPLKPENKANPASKRASSSARREMVTYEPKFVATGTSNLFEAFCFKESSVALDYPPQKRRRTFINQE
jgi:hypothetical protein